MTRAHNLRRVLRYLWLALALGVVLVAVAAREDLAKVDYSRVLGRGGWQLPERVIESLEIRPGDTVADIGAGDGYFTFALADAVGPSGKVFAVDVDDEVVDALRGRVDSSGYTQVVVVRGRYDDPRLPDGRIDLAFLCNAYHHIDRRVDYFRGLKADLSPDGRVAVVEMKDSLLVRLTGHFGHASAVSTIRDELAEAGYEPAGAADFLPLQNLVSFRPQ